MTAPMLALDALCGSPACHGQRCPRVWLCRLDRATATAPGGCPRCGGPLVRHHIYAERATDD